MRSSARTSLRDPAAKAWLLRATAPTSFVTASEIRAKFAGIVFVGDSQLRENAWATMRWLSESQLLRYAHAGEAFNNTRNCPRVGCGGRVVANVCLPEAAGRLGFTAACGPAPPEGGTPAPTEVDLAEIKPDAFCPKSASPSQACRTPSRRADTGARPDSGRRRPTAASSSRAQRAAKARRAAAASRRPRPRLERLAVAVEPFRRPRGGVRFRLFRALRGDLGRRRRRPVVAAELPTRAPPAPQEAASVGGAGRRAA